MIELPAPKIPPRNMVDVSYTTEVVPNGLDLHLRVRALDMPEDPNARTAWAVERLLALYLSFVDDDKLDLTLTRAVNEARQRKDEISP